MHVELHKGDITKLEVDAIVNAANSSLLGGGGVDGAIHRAAGTVLYDECKEWVSKNGQLPTGGAMHTNGGNLPAKHVIHTVGPIWHGGHNDEAGLLAKAYRNSLELASRLGVQTIAFPNISTGIYSYPKVEAAEIAFKEILRFSEQDTSIKKVIFCCFDEENYEIYQKIIKSPENNTLDKF